MPAMRPAARLRAALPTILVALACLAGVLLSAWWLEAWHDREREARLRGIHTLTGTIDSYPAFASAILGGSRGVSVFLPRPYPVSLERRFPVLYVQDGENVFDGATATVAGQEWQLDETAQRMIGAGEIEPLIIVAIDSGGPRRETEYTPTRDPGSGEGGGADRYGRMLVDELKPWLDRRYRTRPGRESTGIAGASLGGLASLYLALRHPDVFSRVASLSPTAGGDDGFMVDFVDGLPAKPDTRIWMDVGGAEGPRALAAARRLRDALVRKGWLEGVDLRYLEAPGARADVAAWAGRLPEVLAFLYPPGSGPAAALPR